MNLQHTIAVVISYSQIKSDALEHCNAGYLSAIFLAELQSVRAHQMIKIIRLFKIPESIKKEVLNNLKFIAIIYGVILFGLLVVSSVELNNGAIILRKLSQIQSLILLDLMVFGTLLPSIEDFKNLPALRPIFRARLLSLSVVGVVLSVYIILFFLLKIL
jgi:hypothetical protein